MVFVGINCKCIFATFYFAVFSLIYIWKALSYCTVGNYLWKWFLYQKVMLLCFSFNIIHLTVCLLGLEKFLLENSGPSQAPPPLPLLSWYASNMLNVFVLFHRRGEVTARKRGFRDDLWLWIPRQLRIHCMSAKQLINKKIWMQQWYHTFLNSFLLVRGIALLIMLPFLAWKERMETERCRRHTMIGVCVNSFIYMIRACVIWCFPFFVFASWKSHWLIIPAQSFQSLRRCWSQVLIMLSAVLRRMFFGQCSAVSSIALFSEQYWNSAPPIFCFLLPSVHLLWALFFSGDVQINKEA